VAILTPHPVTDVIRQMPDDGPGADCRLLGATVCDIRVLNLYVPNGSEVGSDKYAYKLEWLARLRRFLDSAYDPAGDVLLCGDFNVAPEDRDVWDPDQWRGQILCSDAERAAFTAVTEWGLTDALRLHRPDGGIYTWWDYRSGAFHRGWGLRIDHILVTRPLAACCASVEVDRDERKGEKPSDHAPVVGMF
jgi:exodeoxyribonuclease-3